MSGFAVTIVTPPGSVHHEVFREVAETIHHGLRALGRDSVIASEPLSGRRNIVLGSCLLARYPLPIPEGSVLYNLEQIKDNPTWVTPAFIELHKRFVTWDYSPANVAELARLGVDVAGVLPISYAPVLTRIANAPAHDIDVLFIGSMVERRRHILDEIERRGLKVKTLFGWYGPIRDHVIGRAKVLLNMHMYDAKILEQVRISYYLANRRTVLSEVSADPEEDAEFRDGVVFGEYDALPDLALALCRDPERRRAVADTGFQIMRSRPIEPHLDRLLRSLGA